MDTDALNAEMDRLRDDLRAAKGVVDYQALSLKLGKNPTYIQQFVTKRTPRILHAHVADEVRLALIEAQRGMPQQPSRGKVSGRSAIIALLRQIDGFPEGALESVYGVIAGFLNQADASQRQTRLRDQSEPASRRRAAEPSTRKSRLPSA